MEILKLGIIIAVLFALAGLSSAALSSRIAAVQQEKESQQAVDFAGLKENPKELASTAVVSVYSMSGKPVEAVSVYSGGVLKCSTDANGICRFDEREGIHQIKAEIGNNFMEGLKEIKKGANAFEFEVQREFQVKINVVNLLADAPVEGAEIQADGGFAGYTDKDGLLVLSLPEGAHTITVSSIDSETIVAEIEGDSGINFRLIEDAGRLSLGI